MFIANNDIVYLIIGQFVLVITCPGGMYLIYKHDARGCEAPEGGVIINQIYPTGRIINDLFPLLGGCCIDTVLPHRYGGCCQAHYCIISTFMRLRASSNFNAYMQPAIVSDACSLILDLCNEGA